QRQDCGDRVGDSRDDKDAELVASWGMRKDDREDHERRPGSEQARKRPGRRVLLGLPLAVAPLRAWDTPTGYPCREPPALPRPPQPLDETSEHITAEKVVTYA